MWFHQGNIEVVPCDNITLLSIPPRYFHKLSFTQEEGISLARELIDPIPFSIEEVQEMIDALKIGYGYKKENKEAEQTHVIKLRAHLLIIYAIEKAVSLLDAVKECGFDQRVAPPQTTPSPN